MDIEKIAKEMADYYKEDELKWVLDLKRLEKRGYKVERQKAFEILLPYHCSRCKKLILGQIVKEDDIFYCLPCYLIRREEEE